MHMCYANGLVFRQVDVSHFSEMFQKVTDSVEMDGMRKVYFKIEFEP